MPTWPLTGRPWTISYVALAWTPVRLQIVYVTDAENGLQSDWEYSVRLVDSVGDQVDAVLSQRHRSQRLMGEGLKGLRH